MSFSLILRENPAIGDTDLGNITEGFESWRCGTRDVGGNWQGDGLYVADDMETFFMTGVGRRIVARSGGRDEWIGQIVRMEYTKNGQTFVRSMEDLTNRVKVIYTRVGDNLLTNGNVESGSWLTFGTPATVASTASWYSSGSTAMYCLSDAADEGVIAGSAVTIESGRAYVCSMVVNVASGVWTLQVEDDATSTVISQRNTAGCGREWLQTLVNDSNTYTTVTVQAVSNAAGDEAYFDAAFLRTAPVRSETRWFEDTDSIAEYGRIEAVILEREKTDDEADALAQKELAESAWVRTKPLERGRAYAEGEAPPDGVTITCMGPAWTLGWRHALTDGTADADAHVTSLLDESQFFSSTSAVINTNATETYIESGDPVPLWKELEKIIQIGDGTTPWLGGGYPDDIFIYESRPTGTQYQYHNGRMEYYGGGAIPPLEFEPGWCWLSDMPTEPTPAGGDADNDNPKRVWLKETWFVFEDGAVHLEWSWGE